MFGRNTNLFSVIVLLLGAGAVAISYGPARGENVAGRDEVADTNSPGAIAEQVQQTETGIQNKNEGVDENSGDTQAGQFEKLLKMALGSCFGGAPDVAADTEVTIGFDLDDQGRLSGIPEYLGNGIATADMRRLYLNGAAALDECAPYPSEGINASFQTVFNGNGILSLKRTSNPPELSDPSSRQVALAVHKPATQEAENALSLDRGKRREIQLRLRLLGFDPQGVDGVFGQNSRDAISQWQSDKGFPTTGFLNAVQLLALNAQSQAEYAEYVENNPVQAKTRRQARVCRNIDLLGIRYCRNKHRFD